jgi:serpin B
MMSRARTSRSRAVPRPALLTRVRARRALTPVAAVLVTALLASSCIGSNPTGQELKGKADRAAPDDHLIDGAVAADVAFSADLYRAVARNPGNFAYSPYALLRVLAMARAGSAGSTRAQLDTLLHATVSRDLDGGMNALDALVRSRVGDKGSDTRRGRINLDTATALWGQRGTHVKDDLLDLLAADYGTGFRVTDFRSDPENARQAINRWAAEATNDRFKELLPRGDVTQFTRFLAAAASYLQAPWQHPFTFNQNSPTQPFQRLEGTVSDVRMMQVTSQKELRYAEGDGWQAIEVPYLGDELELDILMPAAGQFEAFEQTLSGDRLRGITASMTAQPLDLRMPQFQFTTSTNLHDALSTAGMANAFAKDADFSGVTTDEVLSLSEVIYQGFFGVNEEGSDAPKTVTVQTQESLSGLRQVVVDRPFLFVVRDRQTGLVLIIGRVVSPN